MTVEIGETYLSKRKYNKGRLFTEQWLFGGICQETKEVFLCKVQDRSENTLVPCIKKYINKGSTIISDWWLAYKNIENIPGYNFKHFTVNHSKNFVDPQTGADTQNRGYMECT